MNPKAFFNFLSFMIAECFAIRVYLLGVKNRVVQFHCWTFLVWNIFNFSELFASLGIVVYSEEMSLVTFEIRIFIQETSVCFTWN